VRKLEEIEVRLYESCSGESPGTRIYESWHVLKNGTWKLARELAKQNIIKENPAKGNELIWKFNTNYINICYLPEDTLLAFHVRIERDVADWPDAYTSKNDIVSYFKVERNGIKPVKVHKLLFDDSGKVVEEFKPITSS